jgi:hypothetical protein
MLIRRNILRGVNESPGINCFTLIHAIIEPHHASFSSVRVVQKAKFLSAATIKLLCNVSGQQLK